jgi:glycine/D-amino acid oxidase-like deaminating enzyme
VAPEAGGALWWDALPATQPARPSLNHDLDVDVCILGAGLTGLWTAHALSSADPSLRVAVVERALAGSGASGRNGGWCSAFFPVSDAALVRRHGVAAMRAMRDALCESVDEVGASAAAEGIDCHFAKGGSVSLARNQAQRERAQAEINQARSLGFGERDLRWLDPADAVALVGATDVLGATFTPHCAALQPALLARGLADAVERRGVQLFEHTPVETLGPWQEGRRRVVSAGGTVSAEVVVRATEAWTATLPGLRRAVLPVYSLMVATEPLDPDIWSEIGLAARTTFADHRHLIVYGQRTADGRIAFGGRGAPYHYGSAVRPGFDRDPEVHDRLRGTLLELFPALRDVAFTHAWGGPVAIARDWHPSVGFDRRSGTAWAGGYVGDGVSASNLAGRTLADLITGTASPLTTLPWVGHRSRRWEPEPLRWVGVNAGRWGAAAADRAEEAQRGPGVAARVLGRLSGH